MVSPIFLRSPAFGLLAKPTLTAALVAIALSAGCSPSQGYCAAAAECDENPFEAPFDNVGSDNDSYDVCVANQDGFLRQMRANEEEECQEVASTWEAVMSCAGRVYNEGDECGAFRGLPPFGNDNECEDEWEDFFEAVDDADNDCSETE